MRLNVKRITAALLVFCMAGSLLFGCGAKGSEADYVEGLLNVAYSSDHINNKALDMSSDEQSEAAKQSASAEARFMMSYFNIEDASEDTVKAFEEFCTELYMLVDYSVSGDGENVIVAIKPLQLYSDELQEFVDDFNVRKFVEADESCTEKAFVDGVIKIMKDTISKPEYKDEIKIDVKVTKKDGSFVISDEELSEIDGAMVAYY